MFNKSIKLAASFIAVLATLVVSGCNDFENPNAAATADTQDAGNTDASADTQADNGQGTDASQDLGNQDTAQVEVAQEVTATDAGPKPECVSAADCDDNNACTFSYCDAGKCQHKAIEAKCDDGNACTDNDNCTAGTCKGTDMNCNDNNPCTDDFCIGGNCVHGVNSAPCNDGNACTEKDTCGGAKCAGTPVVCDDNNPCTIDTCDTIKGCTYTPVVCEDNDACTTDTCDSKTGYCLFAAIVCNDNNPYTWDYCDSQFGCQADQKWGACAKDSDCEDGNACTINVCGIDNVCNYPVTVDCNDYDPCTVDVCVPAKGCVNSPVSCDDNNPSTADTCNKLGACVHTPITTPTPPATTGNVTVSITCGAVACEPHLYFGQQAGGTAFDVYGVAPANGWYSVDVPKSQLSIWGLEIAARLTTATWPWFGCDSGAPSLGTLVIKINGTAVQGTLTTHPWVCQGAGQGNLAWPASQFK